MAEESKGGSLKWKIMRTLVGMILVTGILVVAIVYYFTGKALRSQLDRSAAAIATNLSDAAAGLMMKKNTLELHALVTKYARLEGVAYAFIDDSKGEIAAQSLGTFPSELREQVTSDQRRQPNRRLLTYRGRPVYETRMPVLEGQLGAAHVGIWGDVVEEEIYRTVVPIIGLIVIVLLISSVLSSLLAQGIIRPVVGLVTVADKISKGDLDTPVGVDTSDEIGELARSLERMRTSLKAAMVRLSRGVSA